ncbi:MAG: hypothetical protein K0Q49_400 [Haloplasmataceae bacterium]|nr:hypothetical protein [Haloplasmataceae bacterium]
MKTLLKELEHLRLRLRMCIWKSWKRIGTRYKALIKLDYINKRLGSTQIVGKVTCESHVALF